MGLTAKRPTRSSISCARVKPDRRTAKQTDRKTGMRPRKQQHTANTPHASTETDRRYGEGEGEVEKEREREREQMKLILVAGQVVQTIHNNNASQRRQHVSKQCPSFSNIFQTTSWECINNELNIHQLPPHIPPNKPTRSQFCPILPNSCPDSSKPIPRASYSPSALLRFHRFMISDQV